jgi:hypothetical protein
MKMNGFLGSKRRIPIVQPGSKILKEIQLAIIMQQKIDYQAHKFSCMVNLL